MGWCEKLICHLSELSEFGQKTMHLVSGNGHGHNCDHVTTGIIEIVQIEYT